MAKKYLCFSVDGQIISRTDDLAIVGGTKNYLGAEFQLSKEWDGLHQTAVFHANGVPPISAEILNGRCDVPWEVLNSIEFFVGVFAGDLITTNTVRVPVGSPVRTNATPGVQPTPSAYETLVARTEKALRTMPTIGENGHWWVWDADKDTFVDSGIKAQGPQGTPGKDAKSPIVGENGNWFIYSDEQETYVDTGVSSLGLVPYIGENGNWWVGTEDSGIKAQGPQGPQGEIGPMPVKGEHYWTEDDQASIVDDTIKALPKYKGEVEGEINDNEESTEGAGIQSIDLREPTEEGNVYTITLTNGDTYDFVAPVGPAGPAGKDGTNGTNGTNGANGRGVSNIQYDSDTNKWVVTYTDSTTQEIDGPTIQESSGAAVPETLDVSFSEGAKSSEIGAAEVYAYRSGNVVEVNGYITSTASEAMLLAAAMQGLPDRKGNLGTYPIQAASEALAANAYGTIMMSGGGSGMLQVQAPGNATTYFGFTYLAAE